MIKNKLRILRQQNRMTQKQLAQKLEIATSTVGMYEQGRREPNHKTLLNICKLFGVSVDYILKQEDSDTGSKEFLELIENFERTLLSQENLIFNGTLLEKSDVKKIINGIRIGIEVALHKTPK
ncbi:MAG: helix-turn-helix domain-containing protein [Oscillospiraceae bacterium]|jgi:transcriptional regulator with XRE-family HTH domain|nr:helix-turn-helix domain-containing protein [Oscillospiraceae bacterium]